MATLRTDPQSRSLSTACCPSPSCSAVGRSACAWRSAPRPGVSERSSSGVPSFGTTGVVLGVVLARALSRYMESLLVEVTATDATVFLTTAVVVLAVAVIAACAPMYQATRVDPMQSLRA